MSGENNGRPGRNGGTIVPWQKGQSGNPNGRPPGGKNLTRARIGVWFEKKTKVKDEIEGDVDMALQDQMIGKLISLVIQNGDVAAFTALHNRFEGMPTQHIGNDPDAPFLNDNRFANLSVDQLRDLVNSMPAEDADEPEIINHVNDDEGFDGEYTPWDEVK